MAESYDYLNWRGILFLNMDICFELQAGEYIQAI